MIPVMNGRPVLRLGESTLGVVSGLEVRRRGVRQGKLTRRVEKSRVDSTKQKPTQLTK